MKKKKSYKHINKVERKEMAFLLQKGYSISKVAEILKRSKSSISDELKKNKTNRFYDPEKAQHKAYTRRKYSKYLGMKIASNDNLRDYVEEKLALDWSPEQIAGRLKEVDKYLPYASYRVIYKYISSAYGSLLGQCLRYKGKKRKGGGRTKVTQLKDRVFIDKRPKIVENKGRFGDWEGDFIVSGKSGQGVLLVLHERKSRFALVKRIISPNIKLVHQYIFELTGGYILNTLTLDNDLIFRKHKELSEILGAPLYFCHPYHSWEKGGVENTNKLIRQYVPRGCDISKYSDEYVRMIQDKLNNRPRKCLRYQTPLEVMIKNRQLKLTIDDILKVDINNLFKTKKAGVRLEGSM